MPLLFARWAKQCLCVALLFTASFSTRADSAQPRTQDLDIEWAIEVAERYPSIKHDVTYLVASNYEITLDLYIGKGKDVRPTLVFFHGGGWAEAGTKERTALAFLPFLHLGWNVVNVEYRSSSVSLAPAAVEDCICALRWVGLHAAEYHIDVNQVVLMGRSAGGHLALTTGMIPHSQGRLGESCVNLRPETNSIDGVLIRPAAIVNWWGIADVLDLVKGKNRREFAVGWVGSRFDRDELAESISPLSYVRSGLPPIVTIHGDQDAVVPYDQAVRLHSALTKAGVKNKLITVAGANHGPLGERDALLAYTEMLEFLSSAGVRVRVED